MKIDGYVKIDDINIMIARLKTAKSVARKRSFIYHFGDISRSRIFEKATKKFEISKEIAEKELMDALVLYEKYYNAQWLGNIEKRSEISKQNRWIEKIREFYLSSGGRDCWHVSPMITNINKFICDLELLVGSSEVFVSCKDWQEIQEHIKYGEREENETS